MCPRWGQEAIITRGAINVLDELSEHHSELLAKYGLFVTAILDHMEGMELWQVRKVMNILARLTWRAWGKDGCDNNKRIPVLSNLNV